MISIIGSGLVGSAVAFLCVSNALDDVILLNRTKSKAIGESLDIANAIPITSKFSIHGTDDFSKIKESKIVIITASTGIYLKGRTEMIQAQVQMIKDIAEKIKSNCPSAIVLVVSNPLDVLTYVFQHETGFPKNKVIGIASSLDSSRFRYLLSEMINVNQSDFSDVMVLGEHGDSMVPIFSKVKVKEKMLSDIINEEQKTILTKEIRDYWKVLRSHKSRSQFGIAKKIFDITKAIISDTKIATSASIILDGEFGEKDVSMGVPVEINKNGVSKILEKKFNESENKLLKESAKTIRNQIESL